MPDIESINYGDVMSFEDFKNENGICFWWASDLRVMLGYANEASFNKALERTIKALYSLDVPISENIIDAIHPLSSKKDKKLTRFACYMVVMNADPKKREVAQAQAYFATMTRKFEIMIQNPEEIDRLIIRDDIKEGNKALLSAAKKHGVEDFARFTNAGYRGLYNMHNYQLANRRGIDKNQLFDYMGRSELAANLFRITMTEERIQNHNVTGQKNLEEVHYQVGRKIRQVVQENTSKYPEQLEIQKRLPEVKKELKKSYRKMSKEDNPHKKQDDKV